jgi:hypothetical protein
MRRYGFRLARGILKDHADGVAAHGAERALGGSDQLALAQPDAARDSPRRLLEQAQHSQAADALAATGLTD